MMSDGLVNFLAGCIISAVIVVTLIKLYRVYKVWRVVNPSKATQIIQLNKKVAQLENHLGDLQISFDNLQGKDYCFWSKMNDLLIDSGNVKLVTEYELPRQMPVRADTYVQNYKDEGYLARLEGDTIYVYEWPNKLVIK